MFTILALISSLYHIGEALQSAKDWIMPECCFTIFECERDKLPGFCFVSYALELYEFKGQSYKPDIIGGFETFGKMIKI